MRKLNRYIATSVSGAIFMVLFVIVALDAIAGLVDQLGELKGAYNFAQALIYVSLTLPSSIYEFLPFSSLVGCLIVGGIRANASSPIG